MLILGHHVLYGEVVNLEKPLAVAYKSKVLSAPEKSEAEEISSEESQESASVEYTIKAIVKRKLLFKSLPMPIVSHVAKKI